MTYYNTNREDGQELQQSIARTISQEDRVLDFFKHNPHGLFSCREVWGMVFNNRGELTSCQRCITNLANAGLLEKTEKPISRSKYDKKVHKWCLSKYQEEQKQMSLFGG
jgi:hypothetical protein